MFFRLLFIVFCGLGHTIWSQGPVFVKKKVAHQTEKQALSVYSIIPGTVTVVSVADTLSPIEYRIDYIEKTIVFNEKKTDSVWVLFKHLNLDLTAKYAIFDSSALIGTQNRDQWKYIDYENPNVNEIFGGSELSKKGSVSRGVSFGNNQSLGINSTLNLELNGKLSDQLNILASISDANVPIQPNGNTSKLQEFDQVFIQIYNDNLKLITGDFWLYKPDGYFMNYKKRGQGLTFQYKKPINENSFVEFQSSGAFSKGKFNRQIIQGLENNQGPYRLKGSENEAFITVLAGTEKVFIDGRLLQRGQEFDYVIDYNSSEITFSTKNLITKDVRIVVEFQYSDQNYARILLQQRIAYQNKQSKYWLNFYQEQDLKNQTLQQRISGESKQLLSAIGDSIEKAVINSLDSVGFYENQNLYALRDSLAFDSVLVFSIHPDSALYRAYFQSVGAFKGDYVYDQSTAFGKVYKWVAPLGGVPQGDYAAVRLIITPKKRMMLTAGTSQKIGENWFLESELSLSQNNINTFSSIGQDNDFGLANHTKISYETKIGTKGWSTKNQLETEILHAQFSIIEPYRKVEFDRDWNTRNLNLSGRQLFSQLESMWTQKDIGMIKFQVKNFNIGDAYNGNLVGTEGDLSKKGFQARWAGSLLNTQGGTNSSFIRHKAKVSYAFKHLKIGYQDDQEQNAYRSDAIAIEPRSYSFYDYQFYVETADTTKNKVKVFYRERYDWRLNNTVFTKAAKGTTVGLEFQVKNWKNQNLGVITGLRSLRPQDTTLLNITADQTFIGRLEYGVKLWKNAFTFSTYYELGSGLEQKRNFIYLEVNPGQGVYAWVDYNANGVKELNEFEIAAYADQASYIRIFTPSAEYQKVYSNEFNQSVFWKPELIWGNKGGIKGLLSLFSNQTRMRTLRKLNDYLGNAWLNPLINDINDQALTSSNYLFRNNFYFNRTSSKFTAEHAFNFSSNKLLLANGFEGKSQRFQQISMRWNITPNVYLKTEGQNGEKSSIADYTNGRNYLINYQQIYAEASWQPSTNYRLSFSGKIGEKTNSPLFGLEQCLQRELKLELKYNTTLKGSIQAEMKVIQLTFTGNVNSAVAFEMLESLGPGTNYTWNTQIQRNLAQNLQLNLNYLGRKIPGGRTIHSGGIEVRAFF